MADEEPHLLKLDGQNWTAYHATIEGFMARFHLTDFLFSTEKPPSTSTGKYLGKIILGSIPLSLSEEMIQNWTSKYPRLLHLPMKSL